MLNKTRAAVWHAAKDLRIEEREIPSLGADEVKINVAWSGICGTDLHEYEMGPIFIPKGNNVVLGHEFSGIVEEIGENVANVKKGDRVAVNPLITSGKFDPSVERFFELDSHGLHRDGSFADYVVTKAENAIVIPDELPLDKAALTEPLSVAAQAVKEAGVKTGDTVSVFGVGPIGLLTILAAKAAGAKKIYAFDLSEGRLEKASEVGATHAINSKDIDPVSYIKEREPQGVDASFEVAGVKPTFEAAINVTKPGGHVAIVATFAKGFDFNPVSLMLTGVRMSSPLGYERETFKEAVKTLSNPDLNFDPIITKKVELENVVTEGFESLTGDLTQAKILIKLSGKL